MDSDLFRGLVCVGLAVACFTAPVWVPAWAEVAAAEVEAAAEAAAHPEDEFCSGASPDCPSHFEVWGEPVCNSLPPTY